MSTGLSRSPTVHKGYGTATPEKRRKPLEEISFTDADLVGIKSRTTTSWS